MLRLLVGARFQVLFHSPPGVLFTFPSRYWFAIGHWVVLRLGGWSPLIPTGFHVSGGTRVPCWHCLTVRIRGCNPVSPAFPYRSAPVKQCAIAGPTTPVALTLLPVWPHPLSLATTRGVSVDFSSSGYLDVSVPRVTFLWLMCSARESQEMNPVGFTHSETLGSKGMCPSPRIIAACHVLHRLPVPRHPPCALIIFSYKI